MGWLWIDTELVDDSVDVDCQFKVDVGLQIDKVTNWLFMNWKETVDCELTDDRLFMDLKVTVWLLDDWWRTNCSLKSDVWLFTDMKCLSVIGKKMFDDSLIRKIWLFIEKNVFTKVSYSASLYL